jgi:hypothetical protein
VRVSCCDDVDVGKCVEVEGGSEDGSEGEKRLYYDQRGMSFVQIDKACDDKEMFAVFCLINILLYSSLM